MPYELTTPRLTMTQWRLWLTESATGHVPAQVACIELDHAKQIPELLRHIRAALATIGIFSHEFFELGGLVVQRVGPIQRLKTQYVTMPSTNLEYEIFMAIRSLNRSNGPLIVLRFLTDDREKTTMILAAHSLVADPDTVQALLHAVVQKESDAAQGMVVNSFLHYACAEQANTDRTERAVDRWREELANGIGALEIGSRGIKELHYAQSYRRLHLTRIADHQFATLRGECTERGWSWMAFIFANIVASLAEVYASTSFVSHFAASLRTSNELAATPGHFTHFLPIAVRLESGERFADLVTRIQDSVLRATSEPYLPLAEGLRLVNMSNGAHAGFQVLFTYLPKVTGQERKLPGRQLVTDGRSDAGFTFHFIARSNASETDILLDFDGETISSGQAERLCRRVRHSLTRQSKGEDRSVNVAPAPRSIGLSAPALDRASCSDTEAVIYDAWTGVLGRPPGSSTQNFFDAGGTSITLPMLIERVANAVGRRPPLDLVLRQPTIHGIAVVVDMEAKPLCAINSGNTVDLPSLVKLTSDVFRTVAGAALSSRQSRRLCQRRILITGATGYLGRHLVTEILRRTLFDVVCIARPKHGQSAESRVLSSLAYVPHNCRSRLHTIDAELADPWQPLPVDATGYELVINVSASVNFYFTRDLLFDANVNALRPLVEIAVRGGGHLAHVSTLGIFDFDRTVDAAEEPSLLALPPVGGYPETKWVADLALRAVRSPDLRVDIFRPGWIMGSAVFGDVNHRDLIWLLVAGILELAAYPDVDFDILGSPVEAVTAAILGGISSGAAVCGYSYNLPGIRHCSFQAVVSYLERMGNMLQRLPEDEWYRRARISAAEGSGTLATLLAMRRQDERMSGLQEWRATSTNARDILGWPSGFEELSFEEFRRYADSLLSRSSCKVAHR